jgi:hypothetical protein
MIKTTVFLDEKKIRAAKKAFEIETINELLDFALSEIFK